MQVNTAASNTVLAGTGEPFVRIRDVEMEYVSRKATVRALERVNLDIHAGEFVSIVGPSGCGKSTLLMLTAGLLRPSAGQLSIAGKQLDRPYTDIGIVFQRDTLMEWRSVLGNVMIQAEIRGLNRQKARERAEQLLSKVGLEQFMERYPAELSGGMRQRVSICRSLLHDPSLLLMDEPFGALDALTRERMMLDLLQVWEETRKTVFFITHSMAEAVFLSDRVVVMSPRPGRVVETLHIDLPRPRRPEMMNSPEFVNYITHIREQFHTVGVL